MNDVHSSLVVGAGRLDIVDGARTPDSRVPLLRAIDVVMREVVSVTVAMKALVRTGCVFGSQCGEGVQGCATTKRPLSRRPSPTS